MDITSAVPFSIGGPIARVESGTVSIRAAAGAGGSSLVLGTSQILTRRNLMLGSCCSIHVRTPSVSSLAMTSDDPLYCSGAHD